MWRVALTIVFVLINIVVIHFWVPIKKIRKYKKIYQKNIQKKSKKIIGARKGCWNAEKIPKLVEEIQKCKRLKFDSIFLIDESPEDKEKSKIRCLWTQLNFIQGLIEFMEGLIARKLIF
jgi:hypothetical protein